MFSFKTFLKPNCKNEKVAEVIALVITSCSAKEVIDDLLLCTKQHNATIVILPRFGLKKHLFQNFLKQLDVPVTQLHIENYGCCLFYNFKYPEVNDDNHCLFGPRCHNSMEVSHYA